MANVVQFDEKLMKGLLKYLKDEKQVEFEVDEDDFNDQEAVKEVVEGFFEFAGATLGELKSAEEPVTLSLPGYCDITVSIRNSNGNENVGIGVTLGEEVKTRIKDDALFDDETSLDEDEE